MNTKPVVVYHGVLPFEASRHLGLMSAYGRRTVLVYVNPDTVRGTRLSDNRSFGGLRDALSLDHGSGVYPITLGKSLRLTQFTRISQLDRWIAIRRLLNWIKRETKRPLVLVSQRPDLLSTVGGLPADLKIYEVRDDYPAIAKIAHGQRAFRRKAREHMRMLRQNDAVWAISNRLVEDIRAVRPDVFATTVGVEYEDFAAARADQAPEVLRRISSPRVGLIGNLNERVDWDLLIELCKLRPDLQIIVVGPIYQATNATVSEIKAFSALPNGYHLPAVPRQHLGSTIAAMDVCMIPYRINDATKRINPLKLYQYLAVGKPIVATCLPELSSFEDVTFCCQTAREFSQSIDDALQRTNLDYVRRRRARTRAHSWDVVADRQLSIVAQCLHGNFS